MEEKEKREKMMDCDTERVANQLHIISEGLLEQIKLLAAGDAGMINRLKECITTRVSSDDKPSSQAQPLTPSAFLIKPAIDKTCHNSTNQRGYPEQPQLSQSPLTYN